MTRQKSSTSSAEIDNAQRLCQCNTFRQDCYQMAFKKANIPAIDGSIFIKFQGSIQGCTQNFKSIIKFQGLHSVIWGVSYIVLETLQIIMQGLIMTF